MKKQRTNTGRAILAALFAMTGFDLPAPSRSEPRPHFWDKFKHLSVVHVLVPDNNSAHPGAISGNKIDTRKHRRYATGSRAK